MSPRTVGVVVVSRDTREHTLRCVESVLREGGVEGFETRCVLVDNASSDGTVEAVRARFDGRVHLVSPGSNLGFGAACNLGAGAVPAAEHVLFLNADTELMPGALAALVAAADAHPEAAVLGPRLVGADGRPQPSVRGHPTPLALLHQHTALRFLRVGAAAYRRYKPAPPTGDAPAAVPVEVVMGAALLVRGAALRSLGGFDRRYFLYFEEADLCRRAAEAGGRVLFVPAAVVRHAGGSSADRDRERALTWYLGSLFRYVDRFHGRPAGLAYRAVFKPLFLVRLLTDALRDVLALARGRGRASKEAELRLAAAFVRRGMWEFLAA